MRQLILLLALLFITGEAFGQFSAVQTQYLDRTNRLKNPGFENGKTGWTNTGGTFTVTGSNGKVEGAVAGCVTVSAGSFELKNITNLLGDMPSGEGLSTGCVYSEFSGTEFCTEVDGVIGDCATIPDSALNSWYCRAESSYGFGSTSVGVVIRNTGTNTGTVCGDTLRTGVAPAGYVSNVVGSRVHTINWTGSWAGTSATQAAFSAGAQTNTLTGLAIAPSTNIPAIRFLAGSYNDRSCSATFRTQVSTVGQAIFYVYNGSTTLKTGTLRINATGSTNSHASTSVKFILPAGHYSETTYSLQHAISASDTVTISELIIECVEANDQRVVSTANENYNKISYTPTVTVLSGSTPANSAAGTHYRDGSDMVLDVTVTLSGTGTWGPLAISLPSNGCVPSNSAVNNAPVPGVVSLEDVSTTTGNVATPYLNPSNTIVFAGGINQAAPFTWASGDKIVFKGVRVNCSNWKQQSTALAALDIVAFAVNDNANQSLTVPVDIPYSTVEYNYGGGSWNGTQYTVPQAGIYRVCVNVLFSAATGTRISVGKNGVTYRFVNEFNSTENTKPGCMEGEFAKGDLISARANTTNATLSSTATIHWMTISRLQQ